jgi:hypothetical protein
MAAPEKSIPVTGIVAKIDFEPTNIGAGGQIDLGIRKPSRLQQACANVEIRTTTQIWQRSRDRCCT